MCFTIFYLLCTVPLFKPLMTHHMKYNWIYTVLSLLLKSIYLKRPSLYWNRAQITSLLYPWSCRAVCPLISWFIIYDRVITDTPITVLFESNNHFASTFPTRFIWFTDSYSPRLLQGHWVRAIEALCRIWDECQAPQRGASNVNTTDYS